MAHLVQFFVVLGTHLLDLFLMLLSELLDGIVHHFQLHVDLLLTRQSVLLLRILGFLSVSLGCWRSLSIILLLNCANNRLELIFLNLDAYTLISRPLINLLSNHHRWHGVLRWKLGAEVVVVGVLGIIFI